MLPFEERLEQFGQKTTASIDELIALTQSAPATTSAEAAQAMVGRYGRLVSQIGDLSAQEQLPGVKAVCALVETNLLLLQDDKRALTPEESGALEAWPMLLLSYLANRADRDASIALLQNLAHHWPITLPLESTTDELRLLTGENESASSSSAPSSSGDSVSVNVAPIAWEADNGETPAGYGWEQAASGMPGPDAFAPETSRPAEPVPDEEAEPLAESLGALMADTPTEPGEPDPAEALFASTTSEAPATDEAPPMILGPAAFTSDEAEPLAESLGTLTADTPAEHSESDSAETPVTATISEAPVAEEAAPAIPGPEALFFPDTSVSETPAPGEVEPVAEGFGAATADTPTEEPGETDSADAQLTDTTSEALAAEGTTPAIFEPEALFFPDTSVSETPAPEEAEPMANSLGALTADAPTETDESSSAETPFTATASDAPAAEEAIPAILEPEAFFPDTSTPEAAAPEDAAPMAESTGALTADAATGTGEPDSAEAQFTGTASEVSVSKEFISEDPLTEQTASAESVTEEMASHEAVSGETGSEIGEPDARAATPSILPPPDSGIQQVARPMLDILLEELKPLNEAFESVITEAAVGSDDERVSALGDLLDFMQRLKVTVETIGLTALGALLTRFSAELMSLPGGLAEEHLELLHRLPRAMMSYLHTPDASAASAGLVILLADNRWRAPLAGSELAAWRAALANIKLSESESPLASSSVAPATPAVTWQPFSPVEADPEQAANPATEAVAPEDVPASLEAVVADDASMAPAEPSAAETPAAEAEPEHVSSEPEATIAQDPAASAEATAAAPIDDSEGIGEVPSLSLPDTGRQTVEQPMVAILLDELQPLKDEFSTTVSAASQGALDNRLAALGELLDFLERVKMTVESLGLTALAALLAQVSWRIVSLPEGLSEQHHMLLRRLPEALEDYLRAPADASACDDLVSLLADRHWPIDASDDARAAWRTALMDIDLSESSAQLAPARSTEARPEDVSLDLPEEVNPELLDGLLQELPVQVSAFTSAVANITGSHGTAENAEQAMRAAHTLKGAANTVGISGIANLTHHLEDILVALREAARMPQGKLADVLIDAGDCLEAMSEFLLGLGPAPENARDVLQQVLDWANRIDSEGIEELLGEAIEQPTLPAVAEAAPSEQTPVARPEGTETETAEQRQTPQAGAEHALRVPAPLVDELLSLAGETLISNSQLQDHLRSTIEQNQSVHQQHQLILKLVAELETLVDIRGITSEQQGAEQGDFDALEFEHYNELQTISRQLTEATTDAREMSLLEEQQLDALEEVLGEQQRLHMANQRALLRTRMMPVSNIIPRLQRSVRQTGRLLDKPVDFTVRGESTRMDTNVLNDLMDPLMHMLRNAVDHGIEKPDERVAAGKSPEGHIELSFAREGDTIVVRCRDDGAGLDHESIRRIAESKGMIVPGHIHTNDELARLILMPGFSTRGEASQVSGRGVGMDVVYSRVQEMKGMLALHSVKGRGLTIELRLPATLLSMHALIIRQRERRFAISTRGIEDIRYIPRENITEVGARQFVRDGDKIYALLRLEQVLSLPLDRRGHDRTGYPVLLLRMEDGSERAVLIQEVLESREVVMKKFNRFVPHVNGIIGGAILGNGEVAPVIDMFDVLHAPMRKLANVQRAQTTGSANAALEDKPKRALVVDDSLSARRAVVQLLKDEGYETRTANDGLEAVTVLEKWIPDIIISDMEMPRMNGLELTSNVRHAEQTKGVPVIMITSRSTAKHRQMSAAAGVNLHMIKPFSDDELLNEVSKLTEGAQ